MQNSANCGGGIGCMADKPWIDSNWIVQNSASYGGGIYCFETYSTYIVNNVIVENEAHDTGGGIYTDYGGDLSFINNTITENMSNVAGGGLHIEKTSYVKVCNTILWGNQAPTGMEISYTPGFNPNVRYSDVQGGWPGTCNIDADPLFENPLEYDFHLKAGSPCIDVGYNAAEGIPANDFEGDPRISPGLGGGFGINPLHAPPPPAIVDIGADERCALKKMDVKKL
jgi:hypothetical protein